MNKNCTFITVILFWPLGFPFFLCLVINLGASQPSLENRGALSSFCSFNSIISRLWVSAAAWGDDASHCHAADPCWKEFSH